MSLTDEMERRLGQYMQRKSLILVEQLGFGVHGSVFTARSQAEKETAAALSAIKVHRHEREYSRERDVYLRLRELGVTTIRKCRVPQLLDHDDELWIIEMTVVKRPFVLDFAGAYLDYAPDFSEEVLADWRAEKQEEFGERWAEVQAVLRALEGFGVFMVDVNAGNVSFGD